MIYIIDYKVGNLGSIKNMLKHIGYKAEITANPDDLDNATKIILPGVGKFDYGVQNLKDLGFWDKLNFIVLEKKIPILGICLGFQIMTQQSEEGQLHGFGWLDAKTIAFDKKILSQGLKIPHMGWNRLKIKKESPILQDITETDRFYFVHSYHIFSKNEQQIIATSVYGYEFVSAMQKENIFGVQFHPEKSLKYGKKVLKNFIENI